jgi:hypothetical protein
MNREIRHLLFYNKSIDFFSFQKKKFIGGTGKGRVNNYVPEKSFPA